MPWADFGDGGARRCCGKMDQPLGMEVGNGCWMRANRDGGFLAAPQAPIPDLLSDGDPPHLHALRGDVELSRSEESCNTICGQRCGRAGVIFGHWGEDYSGLSSTPTWFAGAGALSLDYGDDLAYLMRR